MMFVYSFYLQPHIACLRSCLLVSSVRHDKSIAPTALAMTCLVVCTITCGVFQWRCSYDSEWRGGNLLHVQFEPDAETSNQDATRAVSITHACGTCGYSYVCMLMLNDQGIFLQTTRTLRVHVSPTQRRRPSFVRRPSLDAKHAQNIIVTVLLRLRLGVLACKIRVVREWYPELDGIEI